MKKAAPKKAPKKTKVPADPYALFRHNIKQLRALEQLTRVKLAKEIKMSARRLQKLETTDLQPTVADLRLYSKRYGIPAETLLDKKGKLAIQFE
jgi:transcriptional regulator with XRE-family HTH domain